MRRWPIRGVAAATVAVLAMSIPPGGSAVATAGTLVTTPFLDEFNGPAGSPPNSDHWIADVGSSAEHGWEEGTLQTYTDSPDNIRLDGAGHLVIQARKDGDSYTSGRLVTRGKLAFGYGTIVAGIKFPPGQGLWPAFWMLGSDIDTVGWPQCGEIDVMELMNGPSTYTVALHGPGTDSVVKGPINDLSQDFHSYWVTRRKGSVTIGVDDILLKSFTPQTLLPDSQWVFDNPMFLLLNLAVGGKWSGPPDESTPFPATMLVDWVRFEPIN